MRSYNRISSHRSKILGSFWGKPAFMGKLVLGRLIVDFRSGGTRFEFSQILDLFHYREQSKGRLFSPGKTASYRKHWSLLQSCTEGTLVPGWRKSRCNLIRYEVYNFPKVTFPERKHLKFESRSFGSLRGQSQQRPKSLRM